MPEALETAADTQLLEQLSSVFAAEQVEPPEQGLRALYVAVASMPTRRRVSESISSAFDRLVRRPWVVVAVTGGLVVAGAGSAAAAGVSLPGPVRSFAEAIGLPVTPSPLSQVQGDVSTLEHDLSSGSPNSQALSRATQALSAELARLDHGDRLAAGDEPGQALDQSCRDLAENPQSWSSQPASVHQACAGRVATSGSPASPSSGSPEPGQPESPGAHGGPGSGGQGTHPGSGGSAPGHSGSGQGTPPSGGGSGGTTSGPGGTGGTGGSGGGDPRPGSGPRAGSASPGGHR